MKIAILGAGNIGGTLGRKWAAAGHQVVFGVRQPGSDKTQALLETVQGTASAATLAQAIPAGDVVLFAIPWDAVAGTARARRSAPGQDPDRRHQQLWRTRCQQPGHPHPASPLGLRLPRLQRFGLGKL